MALSNSLHFSTNFAASMAYCVMFMLAVAPMPNLDPESKAIRFRPACYLPSSESAIQASKRSDCREQIVTPGAGGTLFIRREIHLEQSGVSVSWRTYK